MSMISVEILKKNIPFFDTLKNIEKEYNAKIYIVGFVKGINALTPSSQFVEKGDFVKVKSITLGYSLSNANLSKAGINSLHKPYNIRIFILRSPTISPLRIRT